MASHYCFDWLAS